MSQIALILSPHWREWPAEDCRELQRICGSLMQQRGCGNEPEWLERVGPVD